MILYHILWPFPTYLEPSSLFSSLSHGKLHDRVHSDILYGSTCSITTLGAQLSTAIGRCFKKHSLCYSQNIKIEIYLPTVTENVHILLFPARSDVLHVTVKTPFMKLDPDEGLHIDINPVSTLSVIVGSDHETGLVVLTTAAGQVIIGASVSVEEDDIVNVIVFLLSLWTLWTEYLLLHTKTECFIQIID